MNERAEPSPRGLKTDPLPPLVSDPPGDSPLKASGASLEVESVRAGEQKVDRETRCGFVAIVGRPNAGKSTLMNALLGQHLSIVTPRAQTTWVPVQGILSRDSEQMIFVDTPGLMKAPSDLLHHALVEAISAGVRDADLVLLLIDPSRDLAEATRDSLKEVAQAGGRPLLVALNKCDVASPAEIEAGMRWAREVSGRAPLVISASTGEGLDALLVAMVEKLPVGPFLFPDDEVGTAPVRFFVGELVRETVFEVFRDEIPWSVLPKVEAFLEGGTGGEGRTYIQVTLHVERKSQKGILVGEGGQMVRRVGTISRRKIEEFLGEPVYLELWVKVMPRWRKKRAELLRMGLPVPPDPSLAAQPHPKRGPEGSPASGAASTSPSGGAHAQG